MGLCENSPRVKITRVFSHLPRFRINFWCFFVVKLLLLLSSFNIIMFSRALYDEDEKDRYKCLVRKA